MGVGSHDAVGQSEHSGFVSAVSSLMYRGFVFCCCSVPAVTCGVWTPGAAFGWLMDAALPRAHDAFMGVNMAADAPLFMAR